MGRDFIQIEIVEAVTAVDSIVAVSITQWGTALLNSIKTLIIVGVVVASAVIGLVVMMMKKSYMAGVGAVLGGLVLAVVIAQSSTFGAAIAEESEIAGFGEGTEKKTPTTIGYQDMFGGG